VVQLPLAKEEVANAALERTLAGSDLVLEKIGDHAHGRRTAGTCCPRQQQTPEPKSWPVRTQPPSGPPDSLFGLIERMTFYEQDAPGWESVFLYTARPLRCHGAD
jgi:hypothetical protein